MAKRDQGVAKWHQKQFESSNENKFVSQRAETRESKQRHKELRIKIKDKFWFDSLSFEDKQKVLSNWYFYDPETAVIEGETREDYCKRRVPGCKNSQRDMKIDKLLS